jgi:hypothetical protein
MLPVITMPAPSLDTLSAEGDLAGVAPFILVSTPVLVGVVLVVSRSSFDRENN